MGQLLTPKFDVLTRTAIPIVTRFNEITLSFATGFVVEVTRSNQTRDFLVTNYHVLSGRNALTGACLDRKNAATPNIVDVFHLIPSDWKEYRGRKQEALALTTEDGDHTYACVKLDETAFIDIAILPLKRRDTYSYAPLPSEYFELEYQILVGEQCSVIGFPRGVQSVPGMGVWMAAHVASEIGVGMVLEERRLPAFYVDVRGRRGLSGSPVLYRSRSLSGLVTKFVGVYSSRPSQFYSLGIVWDEGAFSKVLDKAWQLPLEFPLCDSEPNDN